MSQVVIVSRSAVARDLGLVGIVDQLIGHFVRHSSVTRAPVVQSLLHLVILSEVLDRLVLRAKAMRILSNVVASSVTLHLVSYFTLQLVWQLIAVVERVSCVDFAVGH